MVVRTNIGEQCILGQSRIQKNNLQKTLGKLASGLRINQASDDAAGLAVSESMRAQITELSRCQQNVQEGINVTNVADGALAEINSMLRRCHELSIQAANGIYDDNDLESISSEMNQMLDEMDRITAGTTYNNISLFRYSGTNLGEDKYKYIETFEPTADGAFTNWGDMTFIQNEKFDRPQAAVAASVKFKLEDGIDVNNAATLAGKSITIIDRGREITINFNDGSYTFPTGYNVNLSGCATVSDAMRRLENIYSTYSYQGDKISTKVDNDGTVTFTANLETLNQPVNADGVAGSQSIPNGDGTYGNTQLKIISKEGSILKQVDGAGESNNKPVYSSKAENSIKLLSGAITAEQKNSLKNRTLYVAGYTVNLNDFSSKATWEEVGQALAAKLNTFSDLSAAYSANKISIEVSGLSTTNPSYKSITISSESGPSIQASGPGVSLNHKQTANNEKQDIWEIKVSGNAALNSSISLNGVEYIFYDNTTKFPPDGYYISHSSRYRLIGVNPGENLSDKIISTIQDNITDGTVSRDGNVLTVTSNSFNQLLNLDTKVYDKNVTLNTYKNSSDLSIESSYFKQKVSVPLHIPLKADGTIDTDKLAGSGFAIGPQDYTNWINSYYAKKIEFTKGGNGIRADYQDLDISGVRTLGELGTRLETALGSNYNVKVGTNGKLEITLICSGSAPGIMDGYHDTDGIFTNPGEAEVTLNFSGGTKVEQAQKELDFSSINSENLDTLLGKGFRVACATCKGEYINVFFCMNNNGEFPESFEIQDPDDPSITRTIHNIAVELSKVQSGETIVKSIVDQIKPKLTHFTDVEIGDSPSKLVFKDKRAGDLYDAVTGRFQQAEIITGLLTNFNYTVEKHEIPTNIILKYGSDITIDIRQMYVYAGSVKGQEWIPINLPYLDLETLDLQGLVGKQPYEWLDKVDKANNTISACRGIIGTDCNRLEHTQAVLANTHERTTEAESRIRDTDIAKSVVEEIKLSILGKAQQSIMNQVMAQSQQVLELLK